MVLKVLFLIIILYYVLRTVRSLIRAVRNDGSASARSELNREAHRENVWHSQTNGNRRSTENVEDAKWVDL